MSGENREREEEAEDSLSFDAVQEEELPEWATEEASVPDETGGDAGGSDGPQDAAAAVNFANVQTGASESVAVGEEGKRGTAETVDSPDAVGFSAGTESHEDTAGTSLAPDLDEVDPEEFLDDRDDDEFPRPGADGGSAATAGTGAGAPGDATGSGAPGDATAHGTTGDVTVGSDVATAGPSGARLGGTGSLLPEDPALAFGLGMGVMLVVAAVYLFLVAVTNPVLATVVVGGAGLLLAVYVLDPLGVRG